MKQISAAGQDFGTWFGEFMGPVIKVIGNGIYKLSLFLSKVTIFGVEGDKTAKTVFRWAAAILVLVGVISTVSTALMFLIKTKTIYYFLLVTLGPVVKAFTLSMGLLRTAYIAFGTTLIGVRAGALLTKYFISPVPLFHAAISQYLRSVGFRLATR